MSNSESSKRLDPTITAALIGVVGTIIVTLITVLGNRPPEAQPKPVPPTAVVFTETVAPTPQPTDTVPAGDPTSTAEPPTNTPEPIPTATLIPIGSDWSENCISLLWVPYPSSINATGDDRGCLVQPVDKFYTTTGKLAFSYDDRSSGSQVYGMFARLPADGTARVDLRLTTVSRGEIMVGVFASPDVNSDGVLVVVPASNDVTRRQQFIMKTMPGQQRFATSAELSADPPVYDVFFDYNSGSISVKLFKDQVELGTVPVLSGEKWLFLGYQTFNGNNTLQAAFENLFMQAR
jgi:hypothetical protein